MIAVLYDGWPYPWQAGFLCQLAKYGSVSRACDFAGISRSVVYWVLYRNDTDGRFERAWREALQLAYRNGLRTRQGRPSELVCNG